MSRTRINLTGHKYGRLTVLAHAGSDSLGRSSVLCRCKCGVEKILLGNALRNGSTQSCGCLRTPHGHCPRIGKRSPEYVSWQAMKQRCTNPKNHKYKDYGARGITICPEWLESFENFYRDMGPRPEGMTLDRIDNDKGYCPENCRWADAKTQTQNRRKKVVA